MAAACAISTAGAGAADIFISIDAHGNAHYATQRLDSSYEPLLGRAASFASAHSAERQRLLAMIDRIAQRYGLPRELVCAVAIVESNLNAKAVSAKGAMGAMQLTARTAAHYGLTPAQLLDAERNVDAGSRHLKNLLAHYQGNTVLALAAYNAGADAVRRHGQRVPPYGETMLYVPTVLARAAALRIGGSQ